MATADVGLECNTTESQNSSEGIRNPSAEVNVEENTENENSPDETINPSAEELDSNESLNNEQILNRNNGCILVALGRKNNGYALRRRTDGAINFRAGNFEKALSCFNDTFANLSDFWPFEFSTAHCYRGAVYITLQLYELGLMDLKKAKSGRCSPKMKHVLFFNISYCCYKLRKPESAEKYLTKGINCLDEPSFIAETSSETMQYLWKRYNDLASMIKIQFREQNASKVDVELDTDNKMMESSIASYPTRRIINIYSLREPYPRVLVSEHHKKRKIDTSNLAEHRVLLHYGMTVGNVEEYEQHEFWEILGFFNNSNKHLEHTAAADNLKFYSAFCQNGGIVLQQLMHGVHTFSDKVIGLHFRATKPLNPGAIILADEPFVGVLKLKNQRHYCAYCFGRADIFMLQCGYCNKVRFCSERCRANAWKEFHYVECGFFDLLSMLGEKELLCLRIVLKVGVKNFFRKPQPDARGLENPKLEFYDFLDTITFEEPPASKKLEARQIAEIIVPFLNCMYSRISKVEDGSLKVEDVDPTITLEKEPKFTDEEMHILARRIMKHCHQIDARFWMPLTRACSVSLEELTVTESPAVTVFPFLHFFQHSCDPNVYCLRFEGGPLMFRAARNISPGEVLTVAKGVDIYRNGYNKRQRELGRCCKCEACVQELRMRSTENSEERRIVNKLYEAEYSQELVSYLEVLAEELLFSTKGAWLFWRLHGYISQAITGYLERYSSCPLFSPLGYNCVNATIKIVYCSLKNFDTRRMSLYAMSSYVELLLGYIRNLNKLSNCAPFYLKTEHGINAITGLADLLLNFNKEVYCRYALNTHDELCLMSQMYSGESCLKDIFLKVFPKVNR